MVCVFRWREPPAPRPLRHADGQREIQRQRESTRHPEVPPDQRLHRVPVGNPPANEKTQIQTLRPSPSSKWTWLPTSLYYLVTHPFSSDDIFQTVLVALFRLLALLSWCFLPNCSSSSVFVGFLSPVADFRSYQRSWIGTEIRTHSQFFPLSTIPVCFRRCAVCCWRTHEVF